MKNLIALAVLMAIQFAASGRSLTIPQTPNLTRNAGQTIPLTFNASGFADGATAQIWLISTKTWTGDIVEINVPVQNGANSHAVVIPWSFGEPGRYVVKIVCGSNVATDRRVVTIRSAVLWPYFGTVYPSAGIGAVHWVVGDWDLGELMQFTLKNEDTNEIWPLDYTMGTYSGSFQFWLPYGVGNISGS